jgi:hypothetical protein
MTTLQSHLFCVIAFGSAPNTSANPPLAANGNASLAAYKIFNTSHPLIFL